MIELTPDEVNAFNIIGAKASTAKGELDSAMSAQKAMISLLEIKYNAVLDKETGKFIPTEAKKEV